MLLLPSRTLFASFLSPTATTTTTHLHRLLSTTSTRYPLYYDLVVHRPVKPVRPKPANSSSDSDSPQLEPEPEPETQQPRSAGQRRYLRKRRRNLFGDDDLGSSSSGAGANSELVELKPEVVDFPRLHAREEELYFHDAFQFPWEKDKHYRLVHRLEKKFFPEHSLDNAFVSGDAANSSSRNDDVEEDRKLVFFEKHKEKEKEREREREEGEVRKEVLGRKVAELFRCSTKSRSENEKGRSGKKVGNEVEVLGEEQPWIVSRKTELPPRWDGPAGTVVLVDKSKGE